MCSNSYKYLHIPSNTLSIISDCTVWQVEFIADGKCNEELNIHPCNFDGGDCCILEAMTSNCHKDVLSIMHSFVITTPNTSIDMSSPSMAFKNTNAHISTFRM